MWNKYCGIISIRINKVFLTIIVLEMELGWILFEQCNYHEEMNN